jgi:branched-chain amino acid transport system permease protein
MLSFVVTGLIIGSVYALYAVVLVFLHQTTGVINFALGAYGALAAFAFSTFRASQPAPVAVLAAITFGGVLGVVCGTITLPFQSAPSAVKSISSLALLQAITAVIPLIWGSSIRATPTIIRGSAFTFADVVISKQQVLTFVAAVGAAALVLVLFQVGSFGSALRAMAWSPNVARLIGLPVRRLWVISWGLSIMAAAFAGVLVAPTYGMSAASLSLVVLYPLAAAMIAGFRRPLVAAGAAFGLGVADSVVRSGVEWMSFGLFGSPVASYASALPFLAVIASLALSRSHSFSKWERV